MDLDAFVKYYASICFYLVILISAAPAPSLAQRTANVQGHPTKPIRFIVPQATGGSNDIGAILKLPETQTRFTAEGAEIDFRPSAETDRHVKTEIVRWTRVAKDTRMVSEKQTPGIVRYRMPEPYSHNGRAWMANTTAPVTVW
jgi:hypothetical protein